MPISRQRKAISRKWLVSRCKGTPRVGIWENFRIKWKLSELPSFPWAVPFSDIRSWEPRENYRKVATVSFVSTDQIAVFDPLKRRYKAGNPPKQDLFGASEEKSFIDLLMMHIFYKWYFFKIGIVKTKRFRASFFGSASKVDFEMITLLFEMRFTLWVAIIRAWGHKRNAKTLDKVRR